jgi:hypothetical protein
VTRIGLLVTLSLACGTSAPAAQHGDGSRRLRVIGVVRDPAGAPVAGAAVWVNMPPQITFTGRDGRFELARPVSDSAMIEVLQLAYSSPHLRVSELPGIPDWRAVLVCRATLPVTPDWPGMWRRLDSLGVWRLPDRTARLHNRRPFVTDGAMVTLEMFNGREYRLVRHEHPDSIAASGAAAGDPALPFSVTTAADGEFDVPYPVPFTAWLTVESPGYRNVRYPVEQLPGPRGFTGPPFVADGAPPWATVPFPSNASMGEFGFAVQLDQSPRILGVATW